VRITHLPHARRRMEECGISEEEVETMLEVRSEASPTSLLTLRPTYHLPGYAFDHQSTGEKRSKASEPKLRRPIL
jgi:hypothetical protein